MMSWFRTALVFLLLGAAGWNARATQLGPSTEELLRIDVGSIDRPTDDAVVLYRGVHVRMESDGRVTRRVRLVQRLMTDHAIAIGGDPRVAFDTTRQELSIDVCRTIMLDGRKVEATSHAFNRVTPERVASCPDRVGLQEMVVSYVGLERGCLTELDYTLTDRVAWRPWIEGIEELGGPNPVRSGEVWIEAPSGTEVQAQMVGSPSPFALKAEPLSMPMARPWTYGPVPACPDEGGLPAMERVPSLVYTTGSWGTIGVSVAQRLAEASAADSAITGWSRGNMRSGRAPLDDAERLERVAELLGERTLEAEDAPLSWFLPVRPASRTFATSCGNLLDRAALGLAALRAQGINARICLHPTGRSVSKVPALSCFDDIRLETPVGVLSVRQGKAGRWIDPAPATEDILLLESGRTDVRRLREGDGGGPTADGGDRSRLSVRIELLDDATVRGEASIEARGAFVDGLGCGALKAYLDGLASSYVTGGEVAGYSVVEAGPQTLSVVFSFTGKGIGESLGGGRRAFHIPSAPGFPERAVPGGVSYSRSARRTPLLVESGAEEDVTLRLVLPPGVRVALQSDSGVFRGPGAAFESSWSRDGGNWIYHRRFATTQGTVTPAEYPAHREIMVRRLSDGANRAVLVTGTAK
jgi:hypothetical protein